MTDLHGNVPGSLGASTKGLQRRRQKLQADLASQSSTFFMQLHQQMHRKMFPAKVSPTERRRSFWNSDEHVQLLGAFWEFQRMRGRWG